MNPKRTRYVHLVILSFLILAALPLPVGAAFDIPAWRDLPPEVRAKVDPRILAELNGEVIPTHLSRDAERVAPAPAAGVPEDARKPLDTTRFLVYLKAKADLQSVRSARFTTTAAQRTAVFDALVSTARTSQGPVKRALNARMRAGGVASYQPFYIFNGFAVEGDLETVIELARRDDVARLAANYPLVPLWESGEAAAAPTADPGGLDPDNWNVDRVDAERVWDELGVTGEGAVVGGFDSGVDWTHPALQAQYRGYDGAGVGVDHNYNWFEADSALYPGGNLGPSRSTTPYDCDQHGTHTMGTMVGDGGTPGTQVGVAPGAEWIAAPGICSSTMPGGIGDDIGGLKTFQWFLCPTDLSGDLSTADCSKAPDVLNNSWGSCNPADDTFRPAIQALRAAGIAPVFASGNPGAGEGSIGSPGSAPEAITVGATDIDDAVAAFSGRGPSFYEGEQKPELSAPGVNIVSTLPGGGYSSADWSGTSMAAPHVAGLAALMTEADLRDGIRDLTVDELERFMAYTALDLGDPGPDNDYGYGLIDAYDAVRWALSGGDLRGTVTDRETGAPIEGAAVTGYNAATGDTFTAESGATGAYSTTVPAGSYALTADAWGYQSGAYAGQTVVTGVLSIKDFALAPLPTAQLTGRVLSGTTPISGALITTAAHPATRSTTGADGTYTLTLPVGTHTMVVEAEGYRVLREEADADPGGSSHDFAMTPAPTVLLVEADGAFGWFTNRPVHAFFGGALDETGYLYDLWEIEYPTFADVQPLPDGSPGYGVPSVATLQGYDLVIWAHTLGSPFLIGATDELMGYLDGGGRLILSGQDIGYHERGMPFLRDYLHADYAADIAGFEGDTLSGDDFLGGVSVEITSAALHNYENSALGLWPDAAAPRDGAARALLRYDNGSGAAALAVEPCDAAYRAVYLPVGYENIAPRAGSEDPVPAQVIDESIQWAWAGTKVPADVRVTVAPERQTGVPGSTVTYDLQVVNTGATADAYRVSPSGYLWPTRIYSGGVELTAPVAVQPCGVQGLTVEVDVPADAGSTDADTATLTAAGTVTESVEATTAAYLPWETASDEGASGDHWAAGAGVGCTPYAIGGIGFAGQSTAAYERGRWTPKADKPTPFFGSGAAAIDGKIYVPGGFTDGSVVDWAPTDVLEIYDPAADTWTRGASMPAVRGGQSAAAAGGKLYVFGGGPTTVFADLYTEVWAYDPSADEWTIEGDMPYAMVFGGAASLNGKLYVGGDFRGYHDFYEYDPSTGTWTALAPFPDGGRKDPVLVGAGDRVYLYGGDVGAWGGVYTTAFAYDPDADRWMSIPSNAHSHRGGAGALAGGRLWAYGDSDGSWGTESLMLWDAFCLSDKAVQQTAVQPGERITYTLEIHSDLTDLTADVTDPLPPGTTWAGFGANPAGASYNAAQNRVEWRGDLAAGADPLTFTFGVDVDPTGWTGAAAITNTASFDGGAGAVFTRTTATALRFADPAPSTKTVSAGEALAGDTLTYTVRVENGSTATDTLTLVDPIPAGTTYVPGSLTADLGLAAYDPVGDAVTWTGALPGLAAYANTGSAYAWGDSDGAGDGVPAIYDWIDISGPSGAANAGGGDDQYYCNLWLGFPFPFYGVNQTSFCASTNGFLSFDSGGGSDYSNDPLPSPLGNSALIAALWDDLVVEGGIYYQTLGTASNRHTVIQWSDVRHFNDNERFDFQVILYESGVIKVQIQDAGPEAGSSSTTGLEDYTGTVGLTYAWNTPGSIHDALAVVFVPGGTTWQTLTPYADVTFAVTADDPLDANTFITNTAAIRAPGAAVTRSARTLVNPLDLSGSTKTADRAWAGPGDRVTYDLRLTNAGLMTAAAVLTDSIPAHTTYVPGSARCGAGTCAYDAGTEAVTWRGDLAYGAPVTLTFAVTLTDVLPDRTPVTNTAALDDGAGQRYDLIDTFLARSPDLSGSFKEAAPAQVAPGGTVTYTVYARNDGLVAGPGRVRDALPAGLTYVSGSLTCGSGTCGESGGVITWTGTVPGRSMVPVQFRAAADGGADHGDVITNTATVTDEAWNVDHPVAAPVEVVTPADLWLEKAGAGVVEAGRALVYTLTYGNRGPYDAGAPAQVVDTLPAGAVYAGSSPAGAYDASAGTVTWAVGAPDAGISGTLRVTVTVPLDAPPPATLVNRAAITAVRREIDPTNNADAVTTTVAPTSDTYGVALAPATAAHAGEPGAAVDYTVQVLNTGNTTDTFDVALTGGSWAVSAAPMTVGPLGANAIANVRVTVEIPTVASDGDTDTVTVTATSRTDAAQSEDAVLTTETVVSGWRIYMPLVVRRQP